MGCGGWLGGGDSSGAAVLHGYVSAASSAASSNSSPRKQHHHVCWEARWSGLKSQRSACRRSLGQVDWGSWLPVLCAVVLSMVCYANSLDGEFVHDDVVAVVGNPDVVGTEDNGQRTSSLWVNDFWGRPMADPQSHKSYRPLTVLSFRANFLAGGRLVRGYHLVNVALHCACSALVARLAKEALKLPPGPACLAAMLFAAHPVHTEAVSSIVGRAEVLCCFFFLLSFLCYHRCSDAGGVLALRWLLAAGALSGCALLAKEQGISVLPLCMALRVRTLARTTSGTLRSRDKHRGSWVQWTGDLLFRSLTDLHVLVLGGVLSALLAFRLWMLHGTLPQFSEVDNPASFSSRLSTRLLTYSYLGAFNAWLVLCPRTLSYDWQMGSIPLVSSLLDPRNLATVALGTVLVLLFWRACREQVMVPFRSVSIGLVVANSQDGTDSSSSGCGLLLPLLLALLPFLPASNLLVSVGFVVAERVLYIPSIGVCLLVGEGLSRIQRRFSGAVASAAPALTCVLVSLLAVKTLDRNSVWASREALFESGIRDLPENAKMHYNYANLQKDLGNAPLAIKHYRLAIRLWPDHASAHNNLGAVLSSSREAERHFRHALRINPNHPGAHFNLANLFSKRGNQQLARTLLERAVELEPDFCEAYSSLAALAADQGSLARAESLHRMALRSDPRNADARNNYGTFLQTQGRVEEAVRQYQRALELQPNHTVALLNAARSLRSMKLNREAESLYKRALAVQQDPQVMDNLAVFYINAGRADQAREIYEQVHLLFPDHLDSKVHYAQLMMRQRSFRTAEDLLLEAVHRNGSHREALHQTALLYNHTNRTAEALDFILRALRLCAVDDRSCARLHAEHGDILKDLDDLSSSAESYLIAIRLDPELAHAHLNLAVIRHLQGDYTGAFRHYQTAFTLDPKNQLIMDNMAKLRRRLTRPPSKKNASAKTSSADAAFYVR